MGQPGSFSTLDDWLKWLETLSPREIVLGLERVEAVLEVLALPRPGLVINVAGTNGKGSSVAMLEALLADAGHKTGCYTSPHVLRYHERIRIDGNAASSATIIAAFERVQAARMDVPLTYFEFGTLAALWLFRQAALDVWILEVGMGGRLDAVNVVDADVAMITSIDLDHMRWLGNTRSTIAREKAGILRGGRPLLCADRDPPESLPAAARAGGATWLAIGTAFDLTVDADGWFWHGMSGRSLRLDPVAGLLPDNLALVLAALEQVGRLPEAATINERVSGFSLPGRRQMLDGVIPVVLDVCHNPAAAKVLSQWLRERPIAGSTHAIVGMLSDKAVSECVDLLQSSVDSLTLAGLPDVDRGASADWLRQATADRWPCCETVDAALARVRARCEPGDRLVICGSFHTVGAAMQSDLMKAFQTGVKT
jgi:dihydrofolate synthase/folylpolyglutamate synthase